MTDAAAILDKIAEEQGWGVRAQLDLALEYISNQDQADAWEDFLREAVQREADTEPF